MGGKSRNTKVKTTDSNLNDSSNDDVPNPNIVNGKRKRIASAKQGSIGTL